MHKKIFDFSVSTELNADDFLKGGADPFIKSKTQSEVSTNKPQSDPADLSMRRREWEERWTSIGVRLLRTTLGKIEAHVAEVNRGRKHPVTVSEVVRQLLEDQFDN